MPRINPPEPTIGQPNATEDPRTLTFLRTLRDLVNGNLDATNIVAGVIATPTGTLSAFAGVAAPGGYLLCNGAAVSRATFSALFAVIGTTWGVGDSVTTFNVPDLRGRVPIGAGTGTDLTPRTLAQLVGEENHTLTVAELAPHDHGSPFPTSPGSYGPANNSLSNSYDFTSLRTGSTGGGAGHNNIQPSTVVNWLVKT